MKYKPGDVLKIPEKHLEDLITIDKHGIAYKELINDLAVSYNQSKMDFWDLILIIFPGIDKFDLSYDRKNQTIVIKKVTKDKLNIYQLNEFYKKINKIQKEFDL